MRRIIIIFIIGLSIGSVRVAHATPTPGNSNWQQPTPYGTCMGYQPGIGGDFCVNDGAQSFWQQFQGDVTNIRGTPQCSPTNTTQCGKLIVGGIGGVPFVGALTVGQTWCYQVSPGPEYVPCSPIFSGGNITFTTVTASVNNQINVMAPPYNATGLGLGHDDTLAIQTAINDSMGEPTPPTGTPNPSALKPVVLPPPPVCYFITSPLRLYGNGLTFGGPQGFQPQICQNFIGNPIIQSGWGQLTLPYGTSLLTGDSIGHSLKEPAGGQIAVSFDLSRQLNSTGVNNINTKWTTGFFIGFAMNIWQGTTSGQVLCSQPAYPGSGNGAFCIQLNSSNEVTATVNTTGGLVSLSACSAQTPGTSYGIGVNWSGTTYKLWQGTLGGTATLCSSASSTNRPLQVVTEEAMLPAGAPHQYWPDQSSNSNNSAPVYIDGLDMENASTHDSAYTIPTTKPAVDGQTNVLCNFDTSEDGTQECQTGQGGTFNIFFSLMGSNIAYAVGEHIHDLELCSSASLNNGDHPDGIFAIGANNSVYENLDCGMANFAQAEFFNNDYLVKTNRITGFGGHVGIIEGTAFNTSREDNFDIDGVDYAGLIQTGGGITSEYNPFINDRGGMVWSIIQDSSSSLFFNFANDLEVGNTGFKGILINAPTAPTKFYSGTLSQPNDLPVITINSGGPSPDFDLTVFATTAAGELLHYTNGTPTTVSLMTNITDASAIALSDTPQYVKLNGTSFVTFAQLNTITCPTAGLAPDGAQGWLVSNDTTCTTGSPVDGSGSTYCPAICNKNVSGGSWVH